MSRYKDKWQQGMFKPQNPKKYNGDPTKIVYRSSWELKMMMELDKREDVIQWESEEFFIFYISPKDGKTHRYFPDFLVKRKSGDKIVTFLIEVKPLSQTKPPEKKKKITKSYLNEIVTYAVNEAKWKFAQEYCDKRGWIFQLFTEEDLHLLP